MILNLALDLSVTLLKTASTKGIEKQNMTFVDSMETLVNEVHIPVKTLERWNHWYLYNGEYYYLKERKRITNIIRELLGVHLSKYMNLPTIEYSLLLESEKVIGLASKNFRKPGVRYIEGNYSPHDNKKRKENVHYVIKMPLVKNIVVN